MADTQKGLLERALQSWADSQKGLQRAAGVSEEVITMADKSIQAYANGDIKQGMKLAAQSNAQGVIEIHQAAFKAVAETLTATTKTSNLSFIGAMVEVATTPLQSNKVPPFEQATSQQRARWYGQ